MTGLGRAGRKSFERPPGKRRLLGILAALGAMAVLTAQIVLAAPPTGVSFTISNSSPVRSEDGVTFTAAAPTDPEGGTDFTYSWNFGDGTTGSGPTVMHTYAASTPLGQKTVTLTVTDAQSETAVATDTVQVVNATPTVSFTKTPNPAAVGQTVQFTGTASDPDGTIPADNWVWDLDGNGSFETAGRTPSRSYSTPGTINNIRVRVTDADGASVVSSAQSLTINNGAPQNVNFTWTPQGKAAGSAADVGKPVQFNATATDPENEALSYSWNFGDGTGTVTGQNPSHTFTTPGNKSVSLTVSDPHTAAPVVTKTVPVNRPPTASFTAAVLSPFAGQKPDRPLVAPLPVQNTCIPVATPRPGECIEFTSTSTDPDGNGTINKFEWDADGDPATGPEGFEITFTTAANRPRFSYQVPGNKTIRLRVTDTSGAQSPIASLTIRANRRPEVPSGVAGFIFVSPTPIINEAVRFSSQATDPDNDIVKYEWDLDGISTNGAQGFEVDGGANPNRTHTFTTVGVKTVRMRATDEGGMSVVETRQVNVQASRPTGGFSWSPSAPLPGQAVVFNSTASPSPAPPAGKAILKREWDFNFNGADFTADASGDSATASFPTAGPKTVALKITEGVPGSAPDMQGTLIVFDTVVVNAPPSANFSMSNESPFAGDPVTISSTSGDPDGPLSSQQWDLDNDGQFDDAAGPVVSATFARAGQYTLRLRVTDSKGATATAFKQVAVSNRPKPPPSLLQGVVIEIKGSLVGRKTRVKRLLVRAPRGSTVTVRCLGRACPKDTKKASKSGKGAKKLRFRKLERAMPPGTMLIVKVTRRDYIGRVTTFKMLRGAAPERKDLCLPPGAKKAGSCPA
jgi:PKD repeat protein